MGLEFEKSSPAALNGLYFYNACISYNTNYRTKKIISKI